VSIFIGGTEITDIQIGSTAINSVYVGANKVWDRVVSLDTQTVTVGSFSTGATGLTFVGYSNTNFTHGSISDGTSNMFSGAAYDAIDAFTVNSQPSSGYGTFLYIVGYQPNSGWTTMTIDGETFNRTDAGYTQDSTTSWYWTSRSNSPFGTTTGVTKQVVFT